MEIRLLQNLDHPNIVKYLDSIRSDDYLNIILEFVENGSLSSLLGKFQGNFPEQLCSHYITQVLKGLQYLHTQGVIHRVSAHARFDPTSTHGRSICPVEVPVSVAHSPLLASFVLPLACLALVFL